MIYSEQIKKAIRLCYDGLKNQLAEEGMPVLFDWFDIATSLDDENAIIAALIYGAVSSGSFTVQDVAELGFPDEVLRALRILCLKDVLSPKEYLDRIMTSPLAFAVKHRELLLKGKPGRLEKTKENSEKLERYWNTRFALERHFSVPYCLQPDVVNIKEKIIRNRRYLDSIRGAMIGTTVGDAVGYGISKETGEKCISSNTQQMLFVAVGSLYAWTHFQTTGFDATEVDYIYYALQDWAAQDECPTRNICWINSIPELREYRSPDIPCIDLLKRGRCGSLQEPISGSKSASALSRVVPLVLHHKNDLRQDNDNVKGIMKLAACVAAITHGHQLAWLSAALLAHLLSRTIYGGCNTGDNLNTFLREGKQFLYELFGDSVPLHELFEKIDLAVSFAGNKESDDANLNRLGQGFLAHEAVALGIYFCLRFPLDFYSAVTAASRHSGNTATTACITGQIMGAKLGYTGIDRRLIDSVECRDVVLEVATDLTEECHLRKRGEYDDSKWRKKYETCDYIM